MSADFEMRRMAQRYVNEADYKFEVDRALGVQHLPEHDEGTCRVCDWNRDRAAGLPVEEGDDRDA